MPSRRKKIIPKEKHVVGQIMGGLGNQLFIIFTTMAYAFSRNIKYSVINVERKRKTYFDTPLYDNLVVFMDRLINFKRYREPHFHYSPIPDIDKLVLFGYYQSPKYFDEYKDRIIDELDLFKTREEIDYDGFLHFRIGDYKGVECHPICDIDYYIRAFEDIYKRDEGNLRFIYFFEKENWNEVEEKVNILREKFPRFTFEPVDTNIPDYLQMLSMTTLKYCVLANSTFSWWGAYLNKREDKVVYLPIKWFSGNMSSYNTSELVLEGWNKI